MTKLAEVAEPLQGGAKKRRSTKKAGSKKVSKKYQFKKHFNVDKKMAIILNQDDNH
jgi:hypothetical protein